MCGQPTPISSSSKRPPTYRRAAPPTWPAARVATRLLAQHRWTVSGVDFSDVGLDKARRLAADRGVDVDWIGADATTWQAPGEGYHLALLFYLQLPAD